MKSVKTILMSVLTVLAFSVFAQDSAQYKMKAKKQKTEKTNYCCPMHKDQCSNKPGKCPKCKMDMTKAKMYCCSKHKDMTSDKPGKCSKCGMEMKEKTKD
jgi:Heavy metal binding domain